MPSFERCVCAALVSASLAFAAGQAASRPSAPETVRARAFELVDAEGHVLGEWRVDAGGNAIFAMRNSAKDVAVFASTSSPGGALRLYSSDQKEQPGVEWVAASLGGDCSIKNRAGQAVFRVSTSPRDLGGELVVNDAAGLPSILLTRSPAGVGQVSAQRGNAGVWASPDK
ncbi:MAG: hypothetical protein HY286_02170 [Planctomycetes bacterium]|nr:hypothetical protein [Planctomycetota bacterium]